MSRSGQSPPQADGSMALLLRASAQLRETVFHESIANDQAQGNGSPAGDPTAQGRPDLVKARRLRAHGVNATEAHDWVYSPARPADAMSRVQSQFWAPRTNWKID